MKKIFLLISKFRQKCWYIDLFVRPSNNVAVDLYKNLGQFFFNIENIKRNSVL